MRQFVSRCSERSTRKHASQYRSLIETLLSSVWLVDTNEVRSATDAQVLSLHKHLTGSCKTLTSHHPQTRGFKATRDLPAMINIIRTDIQASIPDIRQSLITPIPTWLSNGIEDKNADFVLGWLLRTWLFMPIDLAPPDPLSSNTNYDLKMAIEKILHSSATPQAHHHSNLLSEDFCEQSLTRIGKIQILPTSDLSQHLTFKKSGRRQLYVFRHARMLAHMMSTPHAESNLFPEGFLEETIKTIHLLFPITRYKIKRRVEKLAVKIWEADVEAQIYALEPLDLNEYPFYHERLLEIQRRYDDSKPRTLKQLYFDKRHPIERTTLLVALLVLLLTIIFGVIQSVTGILQVTIEGS